MPHHRNVFIELTRKGGVNSNLYQKKGRIGHPNTPVTEITNFQGCTANEKSLVWQLWHYFYDSIPAKDSIAGKWQNKSRITLTVTRGIPFTNSFCSIANNSLFPKITMTTSWHIFLCLFSSLGLSWWQCCYLLKTAAPLEMNATIWNWHRHNVAFIKYFGSNLVMFNVHMLKLHRIWTVSASLHNKSNIGDSLPMQSVLKCSQWHVILNNFENIHC